MTQQNATPPSHPPIDAGRLWAGGAATALVAALIAVAGIVICRGVLSISILAPEGNGAWGDASTFWYAGAAALAALVATALMHVLILTTPQPQRFFGWVIGLATVIAVVMPFVPDAGLDTKIATAAINAVIGIAIGTLVASVARSAVAAALRRPGGMPPSGGPPTRGMPPAR
ncbi:DUF6069 family protein [Occultella gossypii]|uniref:Integral membrane protein n=1 Tax=Occultella gossypii TaxID=2800820 RepID=A0ABS7S7L0_9MICO|nr:DUF6069 family protein [Occultella gossypii]MBZ2195281.1 hypothetical protein [Occultella gossypii]